MQSIRLIVARFFCDMLQLMLGLFGLCVVSHMGFGYLKRLLLLADNGTNYRDVTVSRGITSIRLKRASLETNGRSAIASICSKRYRYPRAHTSLLAGSYHSVTSYVITTYAQRAPYARLYNWRRITFLNHCHVM